MQNLSPQAGQNTSHTTTGQPQLEAAGYGNDADTINEREADRHGITADSGNQAANRFTRIQAYAGTHRKSMIGMGVAALMLGYMGAHIGRVIRARKRQQEALLAYQDAEAELEAAQSRGLLGIGRKKSALDKAEEAF